MINTPKGESPSGFLYRKRRNKFSIGSKQYRDTGVSRSGYLFLILFLILILLLILLLLLLFVRFALLCFKLLLFPSECLPLI